MHVALLIYKIAMYYITHKYININYKAFKFQGKLHYVVIHQSIHQIFQYYF